jgi:hypothetical protein
MEEIVNKVALSGLVEFNLEDFYDNAERVLIDMKDYLTAIPVGDSVAYILKEKPFRETLNQLETRIFEDKNVAITCSVDAVIPTWAYMLFSLTITGKAKRVIIGNLEMLENRIFTEALSKINPQDYTEAKVVIKGCSKHHVPIDAFVQVANILKPFAKSIMYGEPCSTVPLFKRSKEDS